MAGLADSRVCCLLTPGRRLLLLLRTALTAVPAPARPPLPLPLLTHLPADGQTGSGKTFTIYGNDKLPGLTPRGVTELYNVLDRDSGKASFRVSCYMLELYCDDLSDLLADKGKGDKLVGGRAVGWGASPLPYGGGDGDSGGGAQGAGCACMQSVLAWWVSCVGEPAWLAAWCTQQLVSLEARRGHS